MSGSGAPEWRVRVSWGLALGYWDEDGLGYWARDLISIVGEDLSYWGDDTLSYWARDTSYCQRLRGDQVTGVKMVGVNGPETHVTIIGRRSLVVLGRLTYWGGDTLGY